MSTREWDVVEATSGAVPKADDDWSVAEAWTPEDDGSPGSATGFVRNLVNQAVGGWHDYRGAENTARGIQRLREAQAVQRGDARAGSETFRAQQQRDVADRAQAERLARVAPELAQRRAARRKRIGEPERAAEVERLRGEAATAIAAGAASRVRGEAMPFSPVTQEFLNENSERSIWETFVEAPATIVAEIGVRSAANMLPGLAKGAVGGVVAGPAGFAVGMGAGSARTDLAASIVDNLRRAGVDVTNPEAIAEFVADDARMADLMERTTKRAIAVGGFDALSGLFGTKMLTPFEGVIKRHGANILAQLGLQAGLGAGGEAVGELAEGRDKLSGREIAAEGVGELVTAPLEVAGAALSAAEDARAPDTGLRRPGDAPRVEDVPPSGPPPGAPPAAEVDEEEEVDRLQFERNDAGKSPQMEVRPLTRERFEQYVRPILVDDYANTLEEYQAKHPEATHIALTRSAADDRWKVDSVASREDILSRAANRKGAEVDEFEERAVDESQGREAQQDAGSDRAGRAPQGAPRAEDAEAGRGAAQPEGRVQGGAPAAAEPAAPAVVEPDRGEQRPAAEAGQPGAQPEGRGARRGRGRRKQPAEGGAEAVVPREEAPARPTVPPVNEYSGDRWPGMEEVVPQNASDYDPGKVDEPRKGARRYVVEIEPGKTVVAEAYEGVGSGVSIDIHGRYASTTGYRSDLSGWNDKPPTAEEEREVVEGRVIANYLRAKQEDHYATLSAPFDAEGVAEVNLPHWAGSAVRDVLKRHGWEPKTTRDGSIVYQTYTKAEDFKGLRKLPFMTNRGTIFTPEEEIAKKLDDALTKWDAKRGVRPPAEKEADPFAKEPEEPAGKPTDYQASALRQLARDAGWAQVGGKLIREGSGTDPFAYQKGGDNKGKVTGRTEWIPKAEWWPGRPGGFNEAQTAEIIEKGINGEPLGKKQREYFEFLTELANEMLKSSGFTPTGEELATAGLEDTPDRTFEVSLVARATEVDEDAVEQAAKQFENDEAGFLRAVREILERHEAQKGRGAGARAPGEVDLLGDDTRSAQALADEKKRRDEARSPPRDVSVETGDPTDLFSKARGQADLVDAAKTPKPPPAVSENKVFTEDAAAKARALLKSKLGQASAGVDPEVLQAGITLAGYHIERGARTFAAYSKAMLEDLGDIIRPYLKSWYMAVKYDPRAAEFTDEMDSAAVVDAASVTKKPVTPQVPAIAGTAPLGARQATTLSMNDAARIWKNDLTTAGRLDLLKDSALSHAAERLSKVYWHNMRDHERMVIHDQMVKRQRAEAEKGPTQKDIDAAAHEAATSPKNDLPQPTQAQKEANGEGNYKLGDPVKLHGVTWRVENPKGSYRFKLDARALQDMQGLMGPTASARVDAIVSDLRTGHIPQAFDQLRALSSSAFRRGKPLFERLQSIVKESWFNEMPAHYARAVDVEGADGDKLDAFLGPRAADQTLPVYVIDTNKLDGTGFDEHKVMIGFESQDAAMQAFNASYDKAVAEKIFGAVTEMLPEDFHSWVQTDDVKRPAAPAAAGGKIASAKEAATDERAKPTDVAAGQPAGAQPEAVPGARADQEPRDVPGDEVEGGGGRTAQPDEIGVLGGRGVGGGALGVPETADRDPIDFAVDRRPGRDIEPAVAAPSSPEVKRAKERGSIAPGNYVITAEDEIGKGGVKTKAKQNIEAIRIVKALAAEKRAANADEQAALVKYVGWGGIPQIFDPSKTDWAKEYAELKELLTADEYAAARRSTQDAHYTSETVVRGIYAALERMGFAGGKVLEPAAGIGHFFGMMPEALSKHVQAAGVELDQLTAQIAQHLYPKIKISNMGFQDFAVPDGYYDAVVGNPPFGDQKVFDPERKHLNDFSIHNYFIAKAVETTRPGGVVAVVVSHYFMDSTRSKARQYIAKHANLIGAIRLPNTAFMDNANTEVVTDLVFFQKRDPDGQLIAMLNELTKHDWIQSDDATIGDNDEKAPVNNYFIANPRMVLGRHAATGSMYRENEYTVEPTGDLAEQLRAAIELLPEKIVTPRATKHQAELEQAVIEPVDPADVEHVQVFGYFEKDGKILQRVPDVAGMPQAEVTDIDGAAKDRMRGLIKVRDLVRAQLRLELADDATMEKNRKALNTAYDRFIDKFGYVHSQGNKNAFSDDPAYPLLLSLEVEYDRGVSAKTAKEQGVAPRGPSAHKAAIFKRRVLVPFHTVTSVSNATDALLSSLAERGSIDKTYIEKVYKPFDETMQELGDKVYEEVDGSGWATADEYLSGNVKAKLKQAQAAAKREPRFERNVQALTRVIPADLEPIDIDVAAGSPWVPANYMVDFAKHLFGPRTDAKILFVPAMGKFSAKIRPGDSVLSQKWGTERVGGSEVLEAILTNSGIVVYDPPDADGKRAVNAEDTLAAQEKIDQVRREFEEWVWTDEKRRKDIAQIYNDTFNVNVERIYDGSHLGRGPDGQPQPLRGASPEIMLRPHQKNYVWRFVQTGKTLADHVVGAGKTFAAITAVMERKRIGLINKPIFVVPNHLTEQWGSDFAKLYPGAKVLVARKKDFEKNNRRKFFAKIATGDWDAVIIAHSSFERIAMPIEALEAFVKQQTEDLTASQNAMMAAGSKDRRTIKAMEKAKDRLKAKLEERLEGKDKDDVVGLDELGVDALIVDEAHAYKNLMYSTGRRNVAGLGNTEGSQRAMDMFVKSQYIMQRNGGQNLMYLTGTPISNSIAEMYHVQRYTDSDTLRALGLYHFDAWANTFASLYSDWEVNTSGVGMKQITRFRRFQNFAELMRMYRTFADVVTQQDLVKMREAEGKPPLTPPIAGGGPEVYAVVPSLAQREYMREIVQRAENVKSSKGADNMLLITTHARQAALDMRLRDPSLSAELAGGKSRAAATRIKGFYDLWHEKKGTQLVFIDLSTPKSAQTEEQRRIADIVKRAEEFDPEAMEELSQLSPDEVASADAKFDVYNDLKSKLVALGIPEREIEFIHSANTEIRKEALFERVRQGVTRVLLGSTQKMGAGMNVQRRLVALHHLDAPWKPSDLEQREGRIVRQGNLFYEGDPDRGIEPVKDFAVRIVRYATKGTYDARSWQVLENKARFIEQMRSANLNERRVEDVGGEAATAAAMKAAASENPLIEEEIRLRGDIRKLEASKREHTRSQHAMQRVISGAAEEAKAAAEKLKAFDADIAAIEPKPEKGFVGLTVEGKKYEDKKQAGLAVAVEFATFIKSKALKKDPVGRYRGFDFIFTRFLSPYIVIQGRAYNYDSWFDPSEALDPFGIIQRLDNLLADIPKRREAVIEGQKARAAEVETAKAEVGKPFPQDAELEEKTARQREIVKILSAQAKKQDDGTAVDTGPDVEPIDFARLVDEGGIEDLSAASMAPRQRGGLGVRVIEPFIRDIVSRWKGMPANVVVTTRRDLSGVPENVKAMIGKLDPSGRMMGANHRSGRTIYLFADNLPSLRDAERILVHEAKGHAGVEAYLGDEYPHYRDLVLRVFKKLALEQAQHIGAKLSSVAGRNRVGDEIIATLAERVEAGTATATMLKVWDRIVEAVIKALRALGIKHYRPTKAELRNVIRAAARRVEHGPLAAGARVIKSTSNRGTFDPGAADITAALGPPADLGFRSALRRAAAELKQAKGTAEQMLAMLRKTPGVKEDEIEWTGLGDYLATREGPVTKQEIIDFLDANGVQVEEIQLGGELNTAARRAADLKVKLDALGYNSDIDSDGTLLGVTHRKSEITYIFDERQFVGQDDPSLILPAEANDLAMKLADAAYQASQEEYESGTQYAHWQLPGGENYREVMLTVPVSQRDVSFGPMEPFQGSGVGHVRGRKIPGVTESVVSIDGKVVGRITFWPEHPDHHSYVNGIYIVNTDTIQNAPTGNLEIAQDIVTRGEREGRNYRSDVFRSTHFPFPNIVAHVRLNDRTAADGSRVLFVEEIQSDWGQKARRLGYKDPELPEGMTLKNSGSQWWVERADGTMVNPFKRPTQEEAVGEAIVGRGNYHAAVRAGERGVPRGPFIGKTDSWVSLAVKRILRLAVDGGYDAIAWTTGQQQIERYDLSKHISSVSWRPAEDTRRNDGELRIYGADGDKIFDGFMLPEEIPDHIGKELADRLLSSDVTSPRSGIRVLAGLDIKVGGEGMLGFYDEIVPKVFRDVTKKIGGQVSRAIGEFDVTPAGQQMYEGPEKTAEEVRAVIEAKEHREGRPWTETEPVSILEQLRKVEAAVRHGEEMQDAMRAHASIRAAELLGGTMVADMTPVMSPQPGLRITEALRERVTEGMDLFAALTDPDNETDLHRRRAGAAERRGRALLDALKNGQPIDQAFAQVFNLFGTIDSRRVFHLDPRVKDLARRALDEAKRIIASGRFRWLRGTIQRAHNALNERYDVDEKAKAALETMKRGLIDRYGQDEEFMRRSLRVEADRRAILLEGEEVLKRLIAAGVESQEAEILYRMMTVDGATDAERARLGRDIEALAPEIRQALDHMGREYVELGLLDPGTYEFWRASYLPRSYLKYERERSGLERAFAGVLNSRRKRILGNQFKGRGLRIVKSQERILRDVPEGWWGRRKEDGKADPMLMGARFHVLERVSQVGEGTIAAPGIDPKKVKERVTARVYWPVDLKIPEKWAGYANRGEYTVRDINKNDITLWRDYTREEREQMGEIVDARFAIAKAYTQAANDISNGRFFRDIAANQNWASTTDPTGDSPNASERMGTVASAAEWVRVPETKIAGTNTAKYGALAGMYVRSAIWLDINQTMQMQKAGFWRSVMTTWKLNKTARNPVVHFNNTISNFLLMDLIDVRASDLVRGIRSYMEEDAYYRLALQHGAFGADIVTQELKRSIFGPVLAEVEREALAGRTDLLGLLGRLWGALRALDTKMTNAYRTEDEVFRMATFMREIERGSTPEEAALHAREQFLNYDIRAPWINVLRQTVLPFIAYTYRAVPIIAKSIADRPWKLAKYFTMAYVFNMLAYMLMDDDDEEEERATLQPGEQGHTWVGVERMLRVPFNDRFGNPIFWDVRRLIPAGDVFDMNQGSSALPVPAWLNFGGPLMIGAELMLNKAGFTGEPIVDDLTDSPGEKMGKVGDYLWKSFAPSAPWIPGSWYWSKIEAAATGELDPLMREYSVPLAVSSALGMKLRPHDVALQRRYQMLNLERVERALTEQLRALSTDLARRRIDREFYDERVAEIQTKLAKLNERRAELAPR